MAGIPQRCEFPHLYDFVVKLTAEARQKRQDRELIELFGTIEEQENEEIWKLEQLKR